MQEQVNERTVALAVRGTKLTAQMLARAMREFLRNRNKQPAKAGKPKIIQRGKTTMNKLTARGESLSNIEITDDNIISFERAARKYNIDFSLKMDKSMSPPKWLVFFKAKDADSMTAAFKDFSAKTLTKTKKPSVLDQVAKFAELIKNAVVDRVKNKNRGGHEL